MEERKECDARGEVEESTWLTEGFVYALGIGAFIGTPLGLSVASALKLPDFLVILSGISGVVLVTAVICYVGGLLIDSLGKSVEILTSISSTKSRRSTRCEDSVRRAGEIKKKATAVVSELAGVVGGWCEEK